MIERLIIKNFKCIQEADVVFNKDINILVGNNGVGKSTIIEALSLALGYGLSQTEIVQSLFNVKAIEKFKLDKVPPEILIEVYFDGDTNNEFAGKNNTRHENKTGLCLKYFFDDSYTDLFEKERDKMDQIPCEYYTFERFWFSDQKVIQRQMQYYVQIIDSTSTYFSTTSNQYVNNLIQKYIGDDQNIMIKTALRKLKDDFDSSDQLQSINEEISKNNKELKITIDVSSNIVRRNIIQPLLKDIPVDQIGAGNLCILKTKLSLDKSHMVEKPKIIIIEEPESHLSHTKMFELLQSIQSEIDNSTSQLFITTHNNFIANKLNLGKLLLINNDDYKINIKKLEGDEELTAFFTKVSNYPTLRLILCNRAILVEGPTDEMLVTYFYKKKYDKHPFDDGIELLSVGGVAFKEFVNLVKDLNKRIAIITDNDGLPKEDLLKRRGLNELPDNIKLFADPNTNLNTIEPSFVAKNRSKLQALSDVVRAKHDPDDTEEKLIKFMEASGNKAQWAYRLLTSLGTVDFEVPDHIEDAINWLKL